MPEGTYLVTAADADSAVLRDVDTGQVHTIADPPELSEGDVLEATVEPKPPLEVAYTIEAIEDRREISVEQSDMAPTRHAEELAAEAEVGEVVRQERAGKGEVHVLSVESEGVEDAATDVVEDEETVARAARLGMRRVEVRTGDGFISVRYLP